MCLWRFFLYVSVAASASLVGCGQPPAADSTNSSSRPVFFVGLDGADWQLLDDYMTRGVMPNLARLVREGTSGVLETIRPPLSPLVWTTMMTGVSPLDHGVLDFVQFDPQTGAKEPITSSVRRAPAIWNMASDRGRRVASLGLWATYPAERVNGIIVSDRLFTFLYKESAPPPGVVFPADREPWARDALDQAEKEVDQAALRTYLPCTPTPSARCAGFSWRRGSMTGWRATCCAIVRISSSFIYRAPTPSGTSSRRSRRRSRRR